MESAPAAPGPLASGAVKQKCQKCGGATIVYQSRATKYGRYRRFHCKKCPYRFSITDPEPDAKRLIDDAAVMAIRQSTDGYQELSNQYGCSRELIRQIRNGKIYRDLLPEWFRAPARASDPTCKQCKFYLEAKPEQVEVDAQEQSCSLGIPEFETQGVRAIRDCSAVAIDQQPAHRGPAATEPISDALLS